MASPNPNAKASATMGTVHRMLMLTGRWARSEIGMYTRRVGRYRRNARYVDDRGSNIFGKGVFMISAPPAITELAPDWMMVAMRKKRKRLEVRCAKLSPVSY